ncbi:glycosyltransferase family 2 protein [Hymenobacter sp. 15J16-1T3B]|uniref:glycosyltransferase family 2 protein n=1 Tax=Hymenobacter sp. 15J16-1T3B TaxID=2886941 RepID=UPI001D0FE789|nr:glycosyltransferase family 2 protein [Hymenobacter sp. 15J16-1T3B]MCC3157773.1 glycosyltransferase family 2 protein [Hymenobacter sp. 15J16-1T3B]
MPTHPLSVVIITFNEEANIGRCLAALAGMADDVVVVDSGSTDRTVAICQEHGARVVTHPFAGYVAQKNVATAQARHDHVLQLDADEVLTDALRAEIRRVLADWQHAGYALPRLTNYCGHWVRHGGWYPDRKLRLYDRRLGSWQGQLLHERYEVQPGQTVGQLTADLLHYSYPTIESHVQQLNKFTTIGAEELAERGRRAGVLHLWLKPTWKFWHLYLLRGGWLDGFAGLSIAALSAWGVFLKYAKLRVLTRKPAAA